MRVQKVVVGFLAGVIVAALAGCNARQPSPPLEGPTFQIDSSLVGEPYEGTVIPVSLRPPLNWELLEGQQRTSVLEALSESEDVGDYTLDVEDIFFDTDTLSFLSVSEVQKPGGTVDAAAFIQSFADALGITPETPGDNQIVARMDFVVNDVEVVQFRHLRENQIMQESRVTFTLLFTTEDGRLIRLDYSIPTGSYQRESVKLESSIGTLTLTR